MSFPPKPVTSNLSAANLSASLPRRAFLQVAGATAATASLALAGCKDKPTATPTDPFLLNVGSNDVGLLNYAFLLEQLEAAFYQTVIDAPPADLLPGELAYLNDLRDHEVVHRQTLAFSQISKTPAVPLLTFDFSSLTLNSRAGVLTAARNLEETGVAAYTYLLPLVQDAATRLLLSKIASVEARHAALLNDLLIAGSFAGPDAVVNSGLLTSVAAVKAPATVVTETAAFFLPFRLSVASLPTA